jgi:hypothetical protein
LLAGGEPSWLAEGEWDAALNAMTWFEVAF